MSATGWNARGHDGRAIYTPIALWQCLACGDRWLPSEQPKRDCPKKAS